MQKRQSTRTIATVIYESTFDRGRVSAWNYLKASGRLKSTYLRFGREGEAPAELGFGSAGASPSRYKPFCRSPNNTDRVNNWDLVDSSAPQISTHAQVTMEIFVKVNALDTLVDEATSPELRDS